MVFLFLLLVIVLLVMILYFSKIKIQITNLKFCSKSNRHINRDYEVTIKLNVLGLVPILKIDLTKSKLEKIKIKERVKKFDINILEKRPFFHQELLRAVKKLDWYIQNMNLQIEIGTTNAVLTSMIVPAISTIIAIGLRKRIKKFEKQVFRINPVYQNQNLVNLSISGIFEVKMRHIINIIYILIKKEKKGVKEYERTSNRGSYDYGYE